MLGNIFINNILPAFLVMAVGFVLDRKLHIDKRSLSRMALYVLVPCLVFSSLVESTVTPDQFGSMFLFVVLVTVAMVALAFGVGRLLRWSNAMVDALVLSVAFFNAGNFGLSVILFSFGEEGVELGSIFFVASNLACNTVAAFFASRSNGGAKKALLQVFKLPGLYAFSLAVLLRGLGVTVPEVLFRPVSLIGRAAVPVMLMMLGLQLSQTRLGGRYGNVSVGVALRLVAGGLVALALAPLLGLSGLALSVGVVEAATPTAVTSSLMAIEFDADADYVSSVVFFSTLLSALSLTLLLALLA
ncbi:MAG: AEC family transporter [Chloroflexi bacterium]|nr:AEC family transporter [Chloroflexota bacterium]